MKKILTKKTQKQPLPHPTNTPPPKKKNPTKSKKTKQTHNKKQNQKHHQQQQQKQNWPIIPWCFCYDKDMLAQ